MFQAYKEGLYGRRYVWLIIGWYPDYWYMENDPSIDCTPDQLKVALEGHLTTEVQQYNLNETVVTDTGIVSVAPLLENTFITSRVCFRISPWLPS